MLTLPTQNRRKRQAYLAIRSSLVRRQISRQGQIFIPEVLKFMDGEGISPAGPSFFRYNSTGSTGEMDVEFGCFTDRSHSGFGPIRAGMLPAGSFMSLTWTGNHKKLPDVNAMLMGWAIIRGVRWDCSETEAGLAFGCHIEVFHISGRNEPDPERWRTQISIMLDREAAKD